MNKLTKLFDNNKAWVDSVLKEDPDFFKRLSQQQHPKYLWIGCSDSRVPANQITGLEPGEVFVHRNVANMVNHTDFNCLSVVQFAVEVLKISDIIICGHYGCGGVKAAIEGNGLGLIDNWIRNIKEIYHFHSKELSKLKSSIDRENRLCELNVMQQVLNLSHTSIIQNVWNKNVSLNIHGWIYDLNDGLVKDLGVGVSSKEQLDAEFLIHTKN
jgi:carbonic anhydrase